MKNNKKKLLVSSLIILLPILVGLIFWKDLPPEMTTHWGLDGTADGWSSRPFAVFGLPLFLLVMHWLCLFITFKDPKNKGQNRKVFGMVFWICPITSLFTCGIMYFAAFGKVFHLGSLTFLFIGLLFVVIGNYLPKCKQNHTIGIKVKWTLENEENWNATHRMGGKLWVAGGLMMMACIFLPETLLPIALILLICILVLVPTIYSWQYHKKQLREGTAVITPLPKGKYHRVFTVGALIFTATTLIFVLCICFTGDIEIQYGDTSFTIEASYWNDLTVEYDAIDSIEYRDSFQAGFRTFGFGSPRLSMGSFQNEELGSYTLYAYTKSPSCVLLTVHGKTLAIGGPDSESTKAIYEALLPRG